MDSIVYAGDVTSHRITPACVLNPGVQEAWRIRLMGRIHGRIPGDSPDVFTHRRPGETLPLTAVSRKLSDVAFCLPVEPASARTG